MLVELSFLPYSRNSMASNTQPYQFVTPVSLGALGPTGDYFADPRFLSPESKLNSNLHYVVHYEAH